MLTENDKKRYLELKTFFSQIDAHLLKYYLGIPVISVFCFFLFLGVSLSLCSSFKSTFSLESLTYSSSSIFSAIIITFLSFVTVRIFQKKKEFKELEKKLGESFRFARAVYDSDLTEIRALINSSDLFVLYTHSLEELELISGSRKTVLDFLLESENYTVLKILDEESNIFKDPKALEIVKNQLCRGNSLSVFRFVETLNNNQQLKNEVLAEATKKSSYSIIDSLISFGAQFSTESVIRLIKDPKLDLNRLDYYLSFIRVEDLNLDKIFKTLLTLSADKKISAIQFFQKYWQYNLDWKETFETILQPHQILENLKKEKIKEITLFEDNQEFKRKVAL